MIVGIFQIKFALGLEGTENLDAPRHWCGRFSHRLVICLLNHSTLLFMSVYQPFQIRATIGEGKDALLTIGEWRRSR